VHSAILKLVNARTNQPVDYRLCTIIAAEGLTRATHYSIVHTGSVEHPGIARYFFDVPVGARVFAVSLKVATRDVAEVAANPWVSENLLQLRMPNGQESSHSYVYRPFNDGRSWSQAFSDPAPGVWEVTLNNATPNQLAAISLSGRVMQIPPLHYELQVAAYAFKTIREPQRFGATMRFVVANIMGSTTLMGTTRDLASQSKREDVLTPSSPRKRFIINVPRETTEVQARVEQVSDPNADMNVFLFNCSKSVNAKRPDYLYEGVCHYQTSGHIFNGFGLATTADPKGGYMEIASNPSPGRWVAVVEAAHLNAPIHFTLTDLLFNPKYGSTRSRVSRLSSGRTSQAKGASLSQMPWAVDVNIQKRGRAELGRTLVAIASARAKDAMTIWKANSALLITQEIKRHPKPLRHYEEVWSTEMVMQ
jgi:hypothetical protein